MFCSMGWNSVINSKRKSKQLRISQKILPYIAIMVMVLFEGHYNLSRIHFCYTVMDGAAITPKSEILQNVDASKSVLRLI